MTERKPEIPAKAARPKGRKRRIARRVGLGTGVLVALGSFGFAIAITVLVGKPITAPDWVQTRIEARVAQQLGTAVLGLDEVEIVVNRGWRPRVRLSGVTLKTGAGREIVSFSQVESSLAMQPLLRGEVVPLKVELTGVFVTLRRAATGEVSLSSGGALGAAQTEAASLPDLVTSLDGLLQQPQLQALTEADVYGVTLRYEDARADRAWTADGGRMRMTRTGDALAVSGDFALLGGGTGVATVEANYASQIGSPVAEFGVKLEDVRARDIAAQSPAFAWLNALRAPISGALRSGVDASGRVSPISATLQIGAGVLQPNDETRPIPFRSARTYFNYDPRTRTLRFDDLSVVSDWVTARIEGQALVGGTGPRDLGTLVGQFAATNLQFNPNALFAEPVALDAADMDFRLELDPFRVTLGQMLVSDRGQWLRADGHLTAERDGWRFALDAQMDRLNPDRLMQLWPENLVPRTRVWVAENLLGGHLQTIDLSLRGAPGSPPVSHLNFDFADAEVRFVKTMPPVTDASGHASLTRNRFVVSVDRGQVTADQGGRIDIGGSAFIIPDVTVKDGAPAIVRLLTDSTVTAALSMLNEAPLGVMDRAGLDPALAEGRAVLSGTLSLPLKKGDPGDLRYDVTGTIRDVRTDALVPGKTLASSALTLEADETRVRLSGQGRLGDVPFDIAWSQPIGPEAASGSDIRGTVEISQTTLDEFNIALPPGSVQGKGQGDLVVELPRGAPPRMSLTSNLRGVAMRLAPLGWRKAASTPGTLRIAATLGDRPEITAISLDAAGLNAVGSVTLAADGGLALARFSQVQVGGWLDAPVDLVGRGRNAAPRIEVRGGTIDLRTADFGSDDAGGSGAQSGPLSLALDRLQITDTIALTGMQGTFDTSGGLDGRFTGRINDGAAVSGRVVPQNGRSAVRVQSDNAGGVFASAGIIKQARGGDLNLTLLPVGQDGAFDGTLRVIDTRIKDAPAIADLLSAISIVGLLEQLSGDGILFSEVDGSFRLTPGRMTLTKASATGPSIGISIDGTYDTTTSQLDMQGVVSPVYLLNGIGAIFTRKGEGLIGFSYRLTGAAAKPRVQVNPLSALTPGLFREIFRKPPPDLPPVAGEELGDSPALPAALAPPPQTPAENSAPPRVDSAQGGR